MIEAVGVVVPAHNEEALIPACLVALTAAAAAIGHVPARICVVADACTDQTAASGRLAGVTVVEAGLRCVGAARAEGIAELLRQFASVPPDRIWLATTDADTRVPVSWLTRQLEYAAGGWDAVAGTVEVTDWNGRPARLPAAFTRHYAHDGGPHPHVHGANFGVRASAYLAAGGFQPLPTAEDHDLLRSLAGAGRPVVRASDMPVQTSGRPHGRAPHGFSHLLTALAARTEAR